ncbi:MAG: plasmid mobilization relaxosome protein MobC [Acidobacteria bacterium]|nr:plasmid mobilization relaxosome protein MobC [Acidobacteriota bacterium]
MELAEWQAKAERAGVPVSALLRRAMARTRTWTAEDSAAARELARAVGRVGVNLNQLARWANTHRGAVDALEVLAQLRDIERELAALRPATPPKR